MSQLLAQEMTEREEDTQKGKYLTFCMGEEMYGIEIRHVTEIIGIQPITEVLELPKYIKGIMNLRGKIIPVMDTRVRFKKQAREYDDRTCIIVLNTEAINIGLIVDRVSEVLTMQDEDIVPPPTIGREGYTCITGIGKVGGGVKLLLDCTRLLNEEEIDQLGKAV